MENKNDTKSQQQIFCSYSSADRPRVNGLALLIEALGYKVYIDHKAILPGVKWQASLQEGLEKADVLLVYWTKNSSSSEWVRKEVEFFHARYPNRLLVPVIGDETPLSELLSAYQTSNFCPLINELLDLKRKLEKEGIKPRQINEAIIKRLRDAGIEIEEEKQNRLFKLFAATGFVGLISAPGISLYKYFYGVIETVSQYTLKQILALALAVFSGAAVCTLFGSHDETQTFINSGDKMNDVTYTATIDSDSFRGDAWLGRWDGATFQNDVKTGTVWFEVNRKCTDYSIKTNSSSTDEVEMIEISNSSLSYIDKDGHQIDLKLPEKEKSTGTVTYSSAIAALIEIDNSNLIANKSRLTIAEKCD